MSIENSALHKKVHP